MLEKSAPKIIAHRGASYEYPEQTKAAYLAGIAKGADALECDVRLTRDKQLVCVHDNELKRVTGLTGSIVDYTVAELKEFDFSKHEKPLQGKANPEFTKKTGITDSDISRIITLAELIEIADDADREVGIIIETKDAAEPNNYVVEKALVELFNEKGMVNAAGELDERVELMSFMPDSVRFLHKQFPKTKVVQLIDSYDFEEFPPNIERNEETKRKLIDSALQLMQQLGHGGIGTRFSVDYKADVEKLAKENVKFRCFTVNTEEQLKDLAKVGLEYFEYIITDRPDEIRRLLER
ncbi:MAG: glycerophosphodiester phosphodiesterase family protein [Micrococcaceae bacterium]